MMMDETGAVLGAWNTCWGSRTNALPNELLMILMGMMMVMMMMLIDDDDYDHNHDHDHADR